MRQSDYLRVPFVNRGQAKSTAGICGINPPFSPNSNSFNDKAEVSYLDDISCETYESANPEYSFSLKRDFVKGLLETNFSLLAVYFESNNIKSNLKVIPMPIFYLPF